MKILNIIQRYPPAIGGSEIWCSNISQFLASNGAIIKVATMNLYNIEEFFKEPLLGQQYIKLGKNDFDNGVFVTRYDLWKLGSGKISSKIISFFINEMKLGRTEIGSIFKHSPHSFEMYRRLLHDIKDTDIVHLHAFPYFHNIVGYTIAKIFRKKIVITPFFHPEHPHYEKKIFFRILHRSDAIIAMTNYEKDYFVKKGIDNRKIHVTGCPVVDTNFEEQKQNSFINKTINNLISQYGIDKNAKKIIYIGRKELHKGIDTLIEAVKELACEVNGEFFLFLIGPDTPEFISKYPNLTNTTRLKIIDFGPVSEEKKAELLKISDLLVLPSGYESFGIVFLEAWKHKKPVIGSDRGAIPEVIQDAGLCARYGDAVDLKEKIRAILFNEELSKKLGEAGSEKIKDFSLEKIGKKIINVYSSLKVKKRILIVSHLFPPYVLGGSEIVAYKQAQVLKKLNFDIEIFAGKINNAQKRYLVSKEKGEFKITRINLQSRDFDNNFVNFNKKQILEEFNKTIFKFAPDVVHFHNIYSLTIKMIEECHKMHIPKIMTLHDFWGICHKNILLTDEDLLCDKKRLECDYCQRVLYNNDDGYVSLPLSERNRIFMQYLNMVDLLISPSEYLIQKFVDCGLSRDRTCVINNGIDFLRFKNIKKTKSNKIRFGYIGQIVQHKGIENLLKAVSLLSSKEKDKISLILVGSGEELFVEYCKNLTKELNLSKIIKFFGKIENNKINKIYRNIDVLIVPSIWPENSPVTITEAMAAGTPVLASNIGGIPEFIHDGVNGYLHKYDKPVSLAANIKKIIERPLIINEMRQACLSKAEECDLSIKVKEIAKHYTRLIANN